MPSIKNSTNSAKRKVNTGLVESGHRYFQALKNGVISVSELADRGSYGIPAVISNLVIEAALNNFNKFPSVFLIGRVYKEELKTKGNSVTYRTLDPWREIVKQKVFDAGNIPLDGLAFDLHNEDAVAGAGRAFLHAYLSPVGIVDGRSRLGIGSVEEAKFILSLGGNIGFVVNKNDYEDVVDFLDGKTKKYPSCLPAYYGILDLEPDDIINDLDNVPGWIRRQRSLLNKKAFKERMLPKKIKAIIDYYSLYYARYRGEDLRNYELLLDRIRGIRN